MHELQSWILWPLFKRSFKVEAHDEVVVLLIFDHKSLIYRALKLFFCTLEVVLITHMPTKRYFICVDNTVISSLIKEARKGFPPLEVLVQ